ncbi:hypothetical protein ON010_g730 [Phytophthora cinnamomi]|nr:hypothetical protein ON010_g730 [Phytophthora cinnamomi]
MDKHSIWARQLALQLENEFQFSLKLQSKTYLCRKNKKSVVGRVLIVNYDGSLNAYWSANQVQEPAQRTADAVARMGQSTATPAPMQQLTPNGETDVNMNAPNNRKWRKMDTNPPIFDGRHRRPEAKKLYLARELVRGVKKNAVTWAPIDPTFAKETFLQRLKSRNPRKQILRMKPDTLEDVMAEGVREVELNRLEENKPGVASEKWRVQGQVDWENQQQKCEIFQQHQLGQLQNKVSTL